MIEPTRRHKAHLRHRLPGRARIRLVAPLPDIQRLQRMADDLSALPGVRAVDINPRTGSILLRHDHAYDPIVAATEARLIELLPETKTVRKDPAQEIGLRICQVDALIGRISGGRMDAWGVAFAGLVAGGLVQLTRGQVAGPALTLFGQAATLAMAQPLRKFVK